MGDDAYKPKIVVSGSRVVKVIEWGKNEDGDPIIITMISRPVDGKFFYHHYNNKPCVDYGSDLSILLKDLDSKTIEKFVELFRLEQIGVYEYLKIKLKFPGFIITGKDVYHGGENEKDKKGCNKDP